MSPRTLAAAKIPQDWSLMLDQRAQDEGKSRSQLIQSAIAQYLNQPINQELTLVSLALEVDSLKKQVSMLSTSSEEIAIERDQLNNLHQEPHPSDNLVNPESIENKLVNIQLDYWKLVDQFLNQEHLGRQSSKAKFLVKFVKYLSSQLNGSVKVGEK